VGSKHIIRVWQEVDIDAIEPHLLVAGSTAGDCGNCKEINIELSQKRCPKCGAEFKYIGTRISASAKEAKRIKLKRPDLTIIDLNDFKEIQARKKAHGLF